MILAILQARMSSTRLPGKVLMPILGRPMLALQLERLKRTTLSDFLVVATSDQPDDDPVAKLCKVEDVVCFRGSLDDVLDRFYRCAMTHNAEHVVRLTGDCPLADPEIVDAVIGFYFEQGVDYACNCRPPTLPDGLDVEVLSFKSLESAWREAKSPFEREHVVPFIVDRPERYTIANWTWEQDLSRLRWTVDEPEDLEFVRRIYEALYPARPDFGFRDVLTVLREHPELAEMNINFKRNEGSRR